MLVNRRPDLPQLVAWSLHEPEVACAGAVSLAEDAIELADLARVVRVPLEGVVLGQRPRLHEIADLLVDDVVRQLRRRGAERRGAWIQSEAVPGTQPLRGNFRLRAGDGRRDEDG